MILSSRKYQCGVIHNTKHKNMSGFRLKYGFDTGKTTLISQLQKPPSGANRTRHPPPRTAIFDFQSAILEITMNYK